jgi:putative flippase GtrA
LIKFKQIYSLFNFQFIRFLIVGGINTLFGYGVYSFFIFIGIHYTVAAFLGTILGIIFNFFTTGKIVFKTLGRGIFPKFIIVYFISYCINILGLRLLQNFKLNSYEAGAVLVLPMAFTSYLLLKMFVYTKR